MYVDRFLLFNMKLKFIKLRWKVTTNKQVLLVRDPRLHGKVIQTIFFSKYNNVMPKDYNYIYHC